MATQKKQLGILIDLREWNDALATRGKKEPVGTLVDLRKLRPPDSAAGTGVAFGPGGVFTVWRPVTKQMEEEFEAAEGRNRKINWPRVCAYSRDMLSGSWPVTHQGMAFGTEGQRIDGQHRGESIKGTGVTVWMPLTFNLSAEAMAHIDRLGVRDWATVLTLAYGGADASFRPRITRNLGSVIRRIALGVEQWKTGDTITESEALEMLRTPEYARALEFVQELFPKNVRCITVAPVRAAFARAYLYDEALAPALRRFAHALLSGETKSRRDKWAVALYRALVGPLKGLGGAFHHETYGKTCDALKGFIACAKPRLEDQLVMPMAEPFPLPRGLKSYLVKGKHVDED